MYSATVIKLHQPDPVAERIAAKIDAWRKNESEWPVLVMDLAKELWAARQKHPGDREFGRWLDACFGNVAKALEGHERTGLLLIGKHAETAWPLLQKTERRSVRTFVDEELKPL